MASFDTESSVGLENAAYEFVIVGGGTAGLVVANRLTENPNVRVLVLEAGTNRLNDPRIVVPGLGPATFEDEDFDWNFRSTPQIQLNDRRLLANKGRTLGGSSAINLGMVIYPSRSGFNAWETLGNPGWGWDGMSRYVRKFHTAAGPSIENREFFKGMVHDQKDQGSSGPVQVSFGDQYMPYHAAWMDAFKALGYPQDEDPINGACTGPFVCPGAIDPATHTRSHSAAAYLTPDVQARSNLRVVTGALVEKLVLEKKNDEENAVATGVQFSKGSDVYTVKVNKEVILAAGTTQSSQILELSGVGDENILQSHGIQTIISNPGVGENLQDHGVVSFGYEVADGMPSGDMARDPVVAGAAMATYQRDGSGPLGMVPLVSAFMPLVETSDDERKNLLQQLQASLDSPDVSRTHKKQYKALQTMLQNPDEPTAQYILAPFQLLPREGENAKRLFGLGHPGFFISLVSLLSYPLSRGSVHIQSSDPKAAPLIDHGILRHPVDLEMHARHSMWMDKIAETEPLASLLKKGGERLHTPEPLDDLEKAKELCKELVLSMYHVSGTCAMMPREDGGVVDSRLKVYGSTNIRVVDASIFPLEPRGNIQATVFAVAEKAADIIKQDLS
ncbi:CAZyme family AA3 [Penicillium bovifimosum]|uniref:CAZyme family AA3 n=1 Tax=Penicillium bovifimosum TaxID=126998 RepID=A0A9W9HBR4_9EURO|nr:CAZyme family AA3 [Penicillium bovifimosum]KAJ5143707.1 CAZyme family AA3 [Penicillium bovifimosum]